MSGRKETIAFLRATLAGTGSSVRRVPLGVASVDGCLSGGLKQGALHEIFAAGSQDAAATGFVAGLAVRLGGPLLWIRQDYSALEHGEVAATGLWELGLDPGRLVLLRVPDAAGALRAAGDALTCSALGAVVIELHGQPKLLDLVAYRRLVLGAEQGGVTALLLRFAAEPGIGVGETRWRIGAAPSGGEPAGDGDDWGRPVFDVDLQRNRHGPVGHWVMEWSCDDGIFRPADSGAVVCSPADRSLATAMVA
jgi:protein ImuA